MLLSCPTFHTVGPKSVNFFLRKLDPKRSQQQLKLIQRCILSLKGTALEMTAVSAQSPEDGPQASEAFTRGSPTKLGRRTERLLAPVQVSEQERLFKFDAHK